MEGSCEDVNNNHGHEKSNGVEMDHDHQQDGNGEVEIDLYITLIDVEMIRDLALIDVKNQCLPNNDECRN